MSNVLTKYALILVALLQPIPALAQVNQSSLLEQVTIDDGLSQGYISSILQDSDGFMWFGTLGGLNRYDGYDFKAYQFQSDNPQSLSGNNVSALYEDKSGLLWIGTMGQGLNVLDRKTEQVYRIHGTGEVYDQLAELNIRAITQDNNGNFWIGGKTPGSPYGLFRLEWNPDYFGRKTVDKNLFTLISYQLEPASMPEHNEVVTLLIDKTNHLWIGSTYALYSSDLSKSRPTFEAHNAFLISGETPYSGVFSIVPEGDKLWLGRAGTIQWYKPATHQWGGGPPPQPDKVWVGQLNLDQQDRFWFTDYWGRGLFTVKKDSISSENELPNRKLDAINCVLTDRSNVVWMGRTSRGLYKFSPGINQFNPIKGMFTEQPKAYINHIYEDNQGRIWANNQIVNRQNGAWYQPAIISERLSGFRYVTVDAEGTFWCQPERGVLWSYNPETEYERFYNFDKASTTHGPMYADSLGILWWGSQGVLHRFDIAKAALKSFPYDTTAISNRVGTFNFIIRHGTNGHLWMGTQQGLVRFAEEDERFKIFRHIPGDPQSLSADRVLSVLDDPLNPDRFLWVGTEGGGLNKLDKATGKSERLTVADGLPDNTIYGILSDENGNIWMSTNRGISRYNPQKGVFRNYDVADGLQGNEFNRTAYFKSMTGELVFAGVNGFNIFDPEKISDNLHIPPIAITEFRIGNQAISHLDSLSPLSHSITKTKEIYLSYDQNMISFVYAALDYTNPGKNRYAYQLEGLSDDWIESTRSRLANFTNLDPGTYTFRVKGTNSDGIWNEAGTSIRIVIAPPWWRTWWAYSLYLIVFLAIASLIIITQLRRIRLRHQLLAERQKAENVRELEQVKSRFFSNITHEFRTPLTLILGPAKELIENTSPDKKAPLLLIKQQANQLLGLINQLLDINKIENGQEQVNLNRGNLSVFLQDLVKNFHTAAAHKNISISLKNTGEQRSLDFDADKVGKVVNNLLSNAIKFTPNGGHISVSLSEDGLSPGNTFSIDVEDNGPGIVQEDIPYIFDRFYQSESLEEHHAQGTGIGLALCKELAQIMGGEIVVKSSKGKGAKFTLKLPYAQAHGEITDADSIDSVNNPLSSFTRQENTLVKEPLNLEENSKPLVLLTEDHAELREFVRTMLEPQYQVLSAVNGKSGLALARQHIPDLIISDVMMPEMDGFEFCEQIKTDELTSHIPLIMLTARATLESRLKGLEEGADAYLTKPFHKEELMLRIRKLLENREMLRKKYQGLKRLSDHVAPLPGYKREHNYLTRAEAIVEKFMDDPEFDVEAFCKAMGVSRTQLHRKLKALTNQSTTGFVRTVRLNTARQLLENGAGNVTEVAYAVGFSSQAYFSRCFQEKFGIAPSEVSELKNTTQKSSV